MSNRVPNSYMTYAARAIFTRSMGLRCASRTLQILFARPELSQIPKKNISLSRRQLLLLNANKFEME
jgi:hypothetical protein